MIAWLGIAKVHELIAGVALIITEFLFLNVPGGAASSVEVY
jgi:hypothetical protein